LTVQQISAQLQVDTDTVYRLINYGHRPAVDVSTRCTPGRPQWRVRPADLEEFLARRQSAPPRPVVRRRTLPPVEEIV
jgi:excisionase family DNA binding protein